MIKSRAFIFSVIFTLILLLLISCKRPEHGREAIMVYTSVPIKTVERIKLKFEERYPRIEVLIFRAGTGNILEKIHQELEDGEIKADVIWLADFSDAEELKALDVILKYSTPESEKIIPVFIDPDGFYYGSRIINMVVAYNKLSVKGKLKNYNDLLRPELRGKIGISNPKNSGSALYTIGALLLDKDYGWEYFVKLYGNDCQVIDNNILLTEKIAGGELYAGITIDFSVRGLLKDYPSMQIEYVYPYDGMVVIASPISIVKGSRNIKNSKTFVNWILSKECQEFMGRELGIVSVRNDINIPELNFNINELKVIPANPGQIYRNKENILRIFSDIFSGMKVDELNINLNEQ